MNMEEEKKEEEPKKTKADLKIEQANAAAERLEKANVEMMKLISRQEALIVEKTLSGQTEANIPAPPEDSPEEYAAKVMRNEIPTKDA